MRKIRYHISQRNFVYVRCTKYAMLMTVRHTWDWPQCACWKSVPVTVIVFYKCACSNIYLFSFQSIFALMIQWYRYTCIIACLLFLRTLNIGTCMWTLKRLMLSFSIKGNMFWCHKNYASRNNGKALRFKIFNFKWRNCRVWNRVIDFDALTWMIDEWRDDPYDHQSMESW